MPIGGLVPGHLYNCRNAQRCASPPPTGPAERPVAVIHVPNEPYSPQRGPWRRFLLGSVAIVVLVAAATATGFIVEAKHVESYFPSSSLPSAASKQLVPPPSGGPQTILVIGSDRRADSKSLFDRTDPPHSDTIMLIRMDPGRSQTSILSIPRDLQITLPGYGVQKVNAAYTYGGTALAAATIKRELPGITINHIVDVNFSGFMQVVGALGCVYVFVDRHYYNPVGTGYASIDIQPGYQKLCYTNALSYVRYRHTDSDFVRVERQQDFIRAAARQVNPLDLFANQDQLLAKVKRAVQTDVHGSEVLQLLTLTAYSLGHPLRQVKFQATAGPSYVTATPQQIHSTVDDFLQGTAAKHIAAPRLGGGGGRHGHGAGVPGLTATPAGDIDATIAASIGQPLKFYIPRLRISAGSYQAADVRAYTLDDTHGKHHKAYVISIPAGLVGEYYGVQGMTWANPPLLDGATQTLNAGGRTYTIVVEGSHFHVVSWKSGNALYWVNNTLSDNLTNAQMLKIAESAKPVA